LCLRVKLRSISGPMAQSTSSRAAPSILLSIITRRWRASPPRYNFCSMSANQVINAFDVLGQTPPRRRSLPWEQLPSERTPQLSIAWGSFRQSFYSSVRASVALAPRKFVGGNLFRDCWVQRGLPARAVIAAALWHVVFIVFPFPKLPLTQRHYSAFDNTELTWSGPINDLPLLEAHAEMLKPKPTPRGEPDKPAPPPGADAFHPRQRIFTDPVHPTHPRQMLVNTAAPALAPKILPTLPNMVQLAQSALPERPHVQINQQTVANLRPRERRVATATDSPLPDVSNLEQKPAPVTIASLVPENLPARPKLEINAGVAPRLSNKKQAGDAVAAPDIAQAAAASGGPNSTFIALSATPGPAPPPKLPEGNLAARVSISPEGKQPGAPGGAANAVPSKGGNGGDHSSTGGAGSGIGSGKDSATISISGGNPPPKAGVSGLSLPKPSSPRAKYSRDDSSVDDSAFRSTPPNFAALPPGAKPEAALGGKKIYTLYVNMPNLNSSSGSWILNFSELRMNPGGPHITSKDLAAPVPLRKVDPKYRPTLINEHVEGEVILYAVIRSTGAIDSIQVVRGVDEQLDEDAMEALAQWKFRPAERDGTPVDLEAIIHIPFHPPTPR
jgi:TonB family protein